MFKLTEEQSCKLQVWMRQQDAIAVEMQRTETTSDHPFYKMLTECWKDGYPYTGAIGGSKTYMFTPTSIGLIVKVEHGLTGEIIDLTDYEDF